MVHECDLCKPDANQPVGSSPHQRTKGLDQSPVQQKELPSQVHHGLSKQSLDAHGVTAVGSRFFRSSHPRPSRRKKGRHSLLSRSSIKTSRNLLKPTDARMSLSASRTAFDLAVIAPINLKKPTSEAPFARFAVNPELPTFADIQNNKSVQAFSRQSDIDPVWVTKSRPGPPLFVNILKASESEHQKMETQSLTPTALIDASSEVAETSSDRVSLGSTLFQDDEKSNPATGCGLSDWTSFSPHPAAASACSSSLFDQPIGTHPVLRIPSFDQIPPLSVISTPQLSKSDPGIPSVSAMSPAISMTTPTATLLFNGDTGPSISGLKLSAVSNLSSLGISTTRVPGVTFGSFAGAAAFRATSFSALAAKAEKAPDKPKALLWTERLTFSDLARAASNQESGRTLLANSSPTGSWNPGVERTDNGAGVCSFRLFQNCSLSDIGQSCCSEVDTSSPKCVSKATETAADSLHNTECDTVSDTISDLITSNASDPELPSPHPTDSEAPSSVVEQTVRQIINVRSPKKGSRRRRASNRPSHFLRKPKIPSELAVDKYEPALSCKVNSNNSVTVQRSQSITMLPVNCGSHQEDSVCGTTKQLTQPEPEVVPESLNDHSSTLTDDCCAAIVDSSASPILLDDHVTESHPTSHSDHISCSNPASKTEPVIHCVESVSLSMEPVMETLSVDSPRLEDAPCIAEFDAAPSPVLVDEIITLPLDQADCIELTANPDLVTGSNEFHKDADAERPLTPSKCLNLPENGITEAEMQQTETEPDPAFPKANGKMPEASNSSESEYDTSSKALNTRTSDVVNNTEVLDTLVRGDSNPCPPIRLRLNLKLAALEGPQVRGKKTKKSRRRHSHKAIPIVPAHQNTPMTAVVSARTPTSLSIRLAPRPKVARIPKVQRSLNPPEAHSTASGLVRGVSRRGRRRMPQTKPTQLATTVDPLANTAQHAAAEKPSNETLIGQSTTQIYAVVQNASRSTTAVRSAVSNPLARNAYPPRLGSVFARKIFSTAKQDRRSIYAHLVS